MFNPLCLATQSVRCRTPVPGNEQQISILTCTSVLVQHLFRSLLSVLTLPVISILAALDSYSTTPIRRRIRSLQIDIRVGP